MNGPRISQGGMSWVQRKVLDKFYAAADGQPAALPWHRDQPDNLLASIAASRPSGRALDIGCGSGVFAAHLAGLGYHVTAIDLHADAVAMAHALSTAGQGQAFTVQQADFLDYQPEQRYDLVLDSGCLHNLKSSAIPLYRQRLLDLLAPDGDFVLEHWDKRHPLDWRPVGPIRRSQKTIQQAFAPDLIVHAARSEDFDVPLPIGPQVRGTCYHFRRA